MSYIKGLVSIAMPTYMHEAFIGEAIESVLNQTYSNFELIICDDFSSDSNKKIISFYAEKDHRIKVIYHPHNKGVSSTFNTCFDHCNGEYTCILCGDDIMYPSKLEKQVEFLEKNPNYKMVLHFIDIVNSQNTEIIGRIDKNILTRIEKWALPSYWLLEEDYKFPAAAEFGRSEYFLSARYDIRLPNKGEVMFSIDRFALMPNAKWGIVHEYLSRYRRHENAVSSTEKFKQAILEETYIINSLVKSRYPHLVKRANNSLQSFLFRQLLFNWLPLDYKTVFKQDTNFIKYSYLVFCKLLLKFNLLFLVLKPIKFIKKLIVKQ